MPSIRSPSGEAEVQRGQQPPRGVEKAFDEAFDHGRSARILTKRTPDSIRLENAHGAFRTEVFQPQRRIFAACPGA